MTTQVAKYQHLQRYLNRMSVSDPEDYVVFGRLPQGAALRIRGRGLAKSPFWGRRIPTSESPVTGNVVDKWFLSLVEEVSAEEEHLSERVLREAKRIVHGLRKRLPVDTDIYPMDGGKVAVELYGESGYGFLLVCEPEGSALCVVTVGSVSRRARYEDSSVLPDGFLREGLKAVRPAL